MYTDTARQGWRRVRRATARAGWLGVLLACCGVAAAQSVIIYPRPESLGDERAAYPIALLKLSLSKVGNPYRLAASPAQMQQDRALFAPVATATGLAPLRAGQGHDWPDTEVLRANHLAVFTSTAYDRLFKMLARGHIQYFPRSVIEIWQEIAAHPELRLGAADGIALHYPEALYFFVNKSNTALAAKVERGLRLAIADGSMQKLFDEYYGEAIARAGLARRSIIALDNPLLPSATPLADAALWFAPAPVHPGGGAP